MMCVETWKAVVPYTDIRLEFACGAGQADARRFPACQKVISEGEGETGEIVTFSWSVFVRNDRERVRSTLCGY